MYAQENILLNADGSLKICDFGLARGFSPAHGSLVGHMSEYVSTRWYRAPEIMLSQGHYVRVSSTLDISRLMKHQRPR